MITDYLVSFRSRHRSTKFCQTWRGSLHVTQRLGTMARFGILHLLDLRALHPDQGKFTVGLNLVGYSLTKLVSRFAVSHPSTRHPRSARSAVRTCRDLCRRKPKLKRYRSRSKSYLCWVRSSSAFACIFHLLSLTCSSCCRYFQNTGRLNRSGDAYRTIKYVVSSTLQSCR